MPTQIKRNHDNKPASNKRTLTVESSFSSKTYRSLKKQKDNTHRDLYIITKTLEQYKALAKPNVCYANDLIMTKDVLDNE